MQIQAQKMAWRHTVPAKSSTPIDGNSNTTGGNEVGYQNDLLLPADRLSFFVMSRNALGLIETKGLIAAIEAAVTGIIDEYEVKSGYFSGDLDSEKIVYKKALEE